MDIIKELMMTLTAISPNATDDLIHCHLSHKNVFVAGAGRSGYVARGFAMRLMHLGYRSYFVGDSTTTSIQKEDLLIICSGSGETKSLLAMVEKAKRIQSHVALITINPNSTIGKLADTCVCIPAPSPKVAIETSYQSVQPMGSLFEQSLMIYLDMIVMVLMNELQISSDQMFKNHANLE